MPPDPSNQHQRFEGQLQHVLHTLALARELEVLHQIPILDPRDHTKNYRRPDLIVIDPKYLLSKTGTEGPVELAIEVLSPDDESRDKFPFHAARGVKELWLVDPDTRAFEVYTLRGAAYFAILADDTGEIRAPALGLVLSLVDGPKLRLQWTDGAAEI